MVVLSSETLCKIIKFDDTIVLILLPNFSALLTVTKSSHTNCYGDILFHVSIGHHCYKKLERKLWRCAKANNWSPNLHFTGDLKRYSAGNGGPDFVGVLVDGLEAAEAALGGGEIPRLAVASLSSPVGAGDAFVGVATLNGALGFGIELVVETGLDVAEVGRADSSATATGPFGFSFLAF